MSLSKPNTYKRPNVCAPVADNGDASREHPEVEEVIEDDDIDVLDLLDDTDEEDVGSEWENNSDSDLSDFDFDVELPEINPVLQIPRVTRKRAVIGAVGSDCTAKRVTRSCQQK